jgi:hypothetical protein
MAFVPAGPAFSAVEWTLLSVAAERARETLQSTSAGTMVQYGKASIGASSWGGRCFAGPMALILPFSRNRKTFRRTAAPLPSIKLPATMTRVASMNTAPPLRAFVQLVWLALLEETLHLRQCRAPVIKPVLSRKSLLLRQFP